MAIDSEVIQRYRPEPATERELKAMEEISTTDYSIYSRKLETICEEGKEIFTRMGISEALQSGDCIVAVYTAQGDPAVASVGTYLHALTGQTPIKYILKHFKDDPTVGVHDGDFFFCNEALYGGIHNPDQLGILPIFHKGKLIAWTAAASHEPETGATEPGGMAPAAKTRYDEGLKVPPMKIGEDFTLRTDILDMFVNMVRDERLQRTDTKARAAVCFKVRERFLEVIEDKGAEFIVGLLRKLVETTSQGAKKKIARLNDGIFRSIVFFDTIASDEGLGRIYCTLEKKGDKVKLDFTGSSPRTPSAFNTLPHIVRAHLASMLCQYIFCDMPVSAGLLEPIEIHVPEGRCLNPQPDAAIAGSVVISPIAISAVHECFNKLIFDSEYKEHVAVPLGAAGKTMAYGGPNQFKVMVAGMVGSSMNATGGGARPDMDGIDSAGFWWSGVADSLDIEHEEAQYPYLYVFRKIAMDQGGSGKYRGGSGCASNTILHNTPFFYVIIGGTSWRFPPSIGLFGGYAGGVSPSVRIKGAKWKEMFQSADKNIPTNFHDLLMKKPVGGEYAVLPMQPGSLVFEGDSFALIAVSAGGYGDVLERDPDLVMRDIRRKVTSHWTAKNVYKVAYDPETLRVNQEKTKELREAERQDRISLAKPYDKFMQEWSKKRPRQDILKYYGSWPDAQ